MIFLPFSLNTRHQILIRATAFLIFSLLCANTSAAQGRINHTPVSYAAPRQEVAITAQVVDTDRLPIEGLIYYRIPGESAFQIEEMLIQQFSLSGVIPGNDVSPEGLEYYLRIELETGVVLTYPENAPDLVPPLIITPRSMPAAAISRVKGVKILSPNPGDFIKEADIIIAASFIPELKPEEISLIKIDLDGRDLTPQADISGILFTVTVQDIGPGRHVISVYQILKGKRVTLATWSFATPGVAVGARRAREVHGELTTGYNHEDTPSYTRNTTYLNSRLWGNLGKLNWNGRAYVTSLERGYLQPQNRFLVGLEYGGLMLRVGDTNPRFSEFSLWGVRSRGVSLKITSHYFNFAAAYGQLRRPIEGVITSDTTWTPGTYSRQLMAIRPGFNLSQSATLSFNITKVKDQESSIERGSRPKDNATIGVDLSLKSPKRRLEFNTETAFSLYNDDISPGPTTDAKDFESIMVINQNFQPLPNDSSILKAGIEPIDMASKLVKELIASSMAHRTTLKLSYFRNELSLGYKTIGSSFKSLSSPTVLTDIQGVSVFDRLRLLRNRIYLTVGWENYHNNVNGRNSTTTDRTIISAAASYYSPPGYPNLGFGLRQTERVNNAVPTTVGDFTLDNRINFSSRSYHFHVDHDFVFYGFKHHAAIIWSTDASDDAVFANQDAQQNSIILNLDSRQGRRLETHLAIRTQNQTAYGDRRSVDYLNLSASARYMLLDNQLWVNGGITNSSSSGEENSAVALLPEDDPDSTLKVSHIDFNNFQVSAGLEFRWKEVHSVDLTTYYYAMSDDGYLEFYTGREQPVSDEMTGKDNFAARLTYGYRF